MGRYYSFCINNLKNHIIIKEGNVSCEHKAKKFIVRMSTKYLYNTLLKKTEIPIVSPTILRDFWRSYITLTRVAPSFFTIFLLKEKMYIILMTLIAPLWKLVISFKHFYLNRDLPLLDKKYECSTETWRWKRY